jgi:hypothetical protein
VIWNCSVWFGAAPVVPAVAVAFTVVVTNWLAGLPQLENSNIRTSAPAIIINARLDCLPTRTGPPTKMMPINPNPEIENITIAKLD